MTDSRGRRPCRGGPSQEGFPDAHRFGDRPARERHVHGPRSPIGATDRAQLALPAIEAAVGVLLVLAVAGVFVLGVPDAGTRAAQLDAYATDAARLLADRTAPVDLAAACRSPDGFEARRGALADHLDATLPRTVVYHLRTPYGAVGHPPPDGVPVGRASVPTVHCRATLGVWYA